MNIVINIGSISVDTGGGGRVQVNASASAKLNGQVLLGGFSRDFFLDLDSPDHFNALYAQIGQQAKLAIETANNVSIPFAGLNYIFYGQSISVVTAPGGPTGPNVCAGPQQQPLPSYEPFPTFTGSAFSSHQPASIWFNRVLLPNAVAMSNVNVYKSVGVGIPAGTSTNSAGTLRHSYQERLFVFTRQDFSGNSTNLSPIASASLGITAGMTFTSGSQSFAVSWNTDTTGGTSSMSTTSSNAGWSTIFTGTKAFKIPFVTTLSAGEYFFAHNNSSTSGTTNTNVTLMSYGNGHLGPPTTGSTVGTFGAGGTGQSLLGFGVASTIVATTTMAGSLVTLNASANNWYMNFSNG